MLMLYSNEDGEIAGIGYDMVRSVCKLMHKKCVYSVYYDYTTSWNAEGKSICQSIILPLTILSNKYS